MEGGWEKKGFILDDGIVERGRAAMAAFPNHCETVCPMLKD